MLKNKVHVNIVEMCGGNMNHLIAHSHNKGKPNSLYLDVKKNLPSADIVICQEHFGRNYFTRMKLNVEQLRKLTEELDKALKYIDHPCIPAKPGEVWMLELEDGNHQQAILTENDEWWFTNPIYSNIKKRSDRIIGGEKVSLKDKN